MRILSALLAAFLAAPLALAHSSHRTHIVNTDGDVEFQLVKNDDGEEWASFRRNGVRYVTRDSGVIHDIEKAMERYRDVSREYSRIGERYSELGRQHSELGREHSRLGREHSRLAREASRTDDDSEYERAQRELEREQQRLEARQRALEDKQRELEDEQRKLEDKQRSTERETNRQIERIFEKAIRDGKAKRD